MLKSITWFSWSIDSESCSKIRGIGFSSWGKIYEHVIPRSVSWRQFGPVSGLSTCLGQSKILISFPVHWTLVSKTGRPENFPKSVSWLLATATPPECPSIRQTTFATPLSESWCISIWETIFVWLLCWMVAFFRAFFWALFFSVLRRFHSEFR